MSDFWARPLSWFPNGLPGVIGGVYNRLWCCTYSSGSRVGELSTVDGSVIRVVGAPYLPNDCGGDYNTVWVHLYTAASPSYPYQTHRYSEYSSVDLSIIRLTGGVGYHIGNLDGDGGVIWETDSAYYGDYRDRIREISVGDFSTVRVATKPISNYGMIGGGSAVIWWRADDPDNGGMRTDYELAQSDFSVVRSCVPFPWRDLGGKMTGDLSTIWQTAYYGSSRIYKMGEPGFLWEDYHTYDITNVFELQAMLFDTDGAYRIMNDFSAAGTADWEWTEGPDVHEGFWPIGGVNGGLWHPGDPYFTGSLDGQKYTITDLHIGPNPPTYGGLFGKVQGVNDIRDLTLASPVIRFTYGYGAPLAGYVASAAPASSYFRRCHVTDCDVVGISGANLMGCGGLIGYSATSYLRMYDCSSSGVVDGADMRAGGLFYYFRGYAYRSFSLCVVNGASVGGWAWYNRGNVYACYARGAVTGSGYAGGFLYYCDDTGYVADSYSTGKVVAPPGCGAGFVYDAADPGDIRDCFWDVLTSEQSTSDGGIGKLTWEMKLLATFLAAGWSISPSSEALNDGYPFLAWQIGEESTPYWRILAALGRTQAIIIA